MKTKIKRHYRSVVSVLLSVCMLVSCMTVGLIATDAAKVTDSDNVAAAATGEAVGAKMDDDSSVGDYSGQISIWVDGWNSGYYYNVNSGSEVEIDLGSSHSSGDLIDFKLKHKDSGVDFNKGTTLEAAENKDTYIAQGSETSNHFQYAGYSKIKVKLEWNNNSIFVKITAAEQAKVQISVDNNAALSTTVTDGTNSGSGSSDFNVNLLPGKNATVTVAVSANTSLRPTASLGSTSVSLAFNGTNYVGTFEVPSSAQTLTIETRAKGTYTVSTAVNDASYGTANIVSVGGSAVTPTTSLASVLEDTAIGLQANSASSDHPFASWNKGTNKTAASTTYYVNADDADTSGGTTITVTAQFKTIYYDIRSKAIVGDTTNIISLDARLFDYYYDSEYKSNWLGMSGSEKGTQEPYTIFNRSLREYAEKNGVQVPLYFGTLYEKYDGYTGATTPADLTPASLNSMDYRFYWAASDSNGINALGSVGGNDDPLTGLSGLTLADGTIHHFSSSDATNQNGVPMALFDKDWLTSRSTGAYSSDNNLYSFGGPLATIIDTKFPVVKSIEGEAIDKLCLDVNGKWSNTNYIYAWIWKDGGIGGKWVKLTKSGSYYYVDLPSGYTHARFASLENDPSDLTSYSSATISYTNNYSKDLDIVQADHSYYELGGWDGNPTFGGSWKTNDNVNVTMSGGHAYYGYNSLNGEDNAYFTGIHGDAIDPVMNYKSGANDSWSIKDDKNAYSFLPFDSNHHGSNGVDYGFGMNMSVDFTLGAYDDDGTTKYGKNEDGTDQIFEFSGDDDLWVFVDGKLVLDLGGAHGRTNGEINFRTLTVSTWDQSNNSTPVAMSNAGGTSGLPAVTAVTRNSSPFTLENKSKHTLTIYYMERGQLESNLKFSFTFEPVGNELQLHKDISTENVNTALAAEVETLATANDTFSFNESWSETVNGKFAPISGKAYTFTHDSKEGTGTTDNTGTVPNGVTVDDSTYSTFSIGDNASFVDQYKDELGHYVKLVETFGESNIYSYSKALSVLDLVTSNNRSLETGHDDIFEFDTTKANPNRDFDATRLKATYTNSVLTKSVTITKAVAETDVDNPDFTVKVRVQLPGGSMAAYQLASTSGTLNTDGTFTFKAGGSNTISGIPVGATVEVTEVSLPQDYSMTGWTVTCTDASTLNTDTSAHTFVIPSDGADTVTVALTNTKAAGKNVKIYKTLTSGTSAQTYTMFIKTVSALDDVSPADYDGTYTVKNVSDDTTVGTANQTYTSAGVSITTAQYILLENVSTSTKLEVTEKVLSSAYVRAFHYAYTKVGIGRAEQAQVTATSGADPIAVDNGVRFSVTNDTVVNVYNKPWTYSIKYNYPAYLARYYGTTPPQQFYVKTGAFTDADFDETTGLLTIDSINDSNVTPRPCPVFKDMTHTYAEIKDRLSSFITTKAPYEDNFMSTLTWNPIFAASGSVAPNTPISYKPLSVNANVEIETNADERPNKTVYAYFRLPYTHESWSTSDRKRLDPIATDGKVLKKEWVNYKVETQYGTWVTLNNATTKSEAQWVEAAPEIYDSSNGKTYVFDHWQMTSIGKNDSFIDVDHHDKPARLHELKLEIPYKRCYNLAFNMTMYQDSYVEAIYVEKGTERANMTQQQKEAVDTDQVSNGAVINFLENSRNQWNNNGGKLYGPSYEKIASRVAQGDRIFSDFLLSFHMENDITLAGDLSNTVKEQAIDEQGNPVVDDEGHSVMVDKSYPILKDGSETVNYQIGVVIERVGELSKDGDNYVVETQETYKTRYDAVEALVLQKNNVETYLTAGTNPGSKYLKDEFSAKALDNKNEMEYSYSLPVNNSKNRQNYVYRAFAYLKDYTIDPNATYTFNGTNIAATALGDHTGAILKVSDPVYFTIYDMASIKDGETYSGGGQS